MKYLSIDLETTGLDPKTDQVLEFACVVADSGNLDQNVMDMPCFRRVCVPRDGMIKGHVKALVMNADLIRAISEGGGGNACLVDRLPEEFYDWLSQQGFELDTSKQVNYGGQHVWNPFKSFVAAGKNFSGFDRPFIENQWPEFQRIIPFKHRVLDPGAMWVDASDKEPPNLELCKQRAGILGSVEHRALDDARDVVGCIQTYFKRWNQFLEESREWHVMGRQAALDLESMSRTMQCKPSEVKAFVGIVRTAYQSLKTDARIQFIKGLAGNNDVKAWLDRMDV